MKINELLKQVSDLVQTREIISHGSIRCLHCEQSVREIEQAEGCNRVGTGLIGDNGLAAELAELTTDGDRIAEIDTDDLANLADCFRGPDISDYVDSEREDELCKLVALIDAAMEITV